MPPWTNPRTAVSNADFTSDWYNAEVRDNLLFLYNGLPFYVQTPGGIDDHYAPAAGQAVLQPVTPPHPCQISGFTYNVSSNSGNFDLGVYLDNGDGTAELIESTGSIAMPTAGLQTTPFATAVNLEAFVLYWFAYAHDTTSGQLFGTKGPAAGIARVINASFPLPATITIGSNTRNDVWTLGAVATPVT